MVQIYTLKKHYASIKENILYFSSKIGQIYIKKTKIEGSEKNTKKGQPLRLPPDLYFVKYLFFYIQ